MASSTLWASCFNRVVLCLDPVQVSTVIQSAPSGAHEDGQETLLGAVSAAHQLRYMRIVPRTSK